MTEQDKQALIKHYCERDCGEAAKDCTIMPCHEIELIQEFPTTEADTDTISRQAAIEEAKEWIEAVYCEHDEIRERMAIKHVINGIKELPPAQPARIKGHWIESNGLNILMKKFIAKGETWRLCDKCGAGFMIGYQYECDKLYHETWHNFCPNCGAEMEVTT